VSDAPRRGIAAPPSGVQPPSVSIDVVTARDVRGDHHVLVHPGGARSDHGLSIFFLKIVIENLNIEIFLFSSKKECRSFQN
jgi:hypothetical protein